MNIVYVFAFLGVLALICYLFSVFFGSFSGNDHDADSAAFTAGFLAIWSGAGFASLCFTQHFWIALGASLGTAVLIQCAVNYFKHRHYPQKTHRS